MICTCVPLCGENGSGAIPCTYADSFVDLAVCKAMILNCAVVVGRRYAACGPPEENIWVVFLLVEAIMFGMFTCCMLQDQSITLDTNLTKIDRLKYAGGQDSSSLSPYADGHSNEVGTRYLLYLLYPYDISTIVPYYVYTVLIANLSFLVFRL